MGAVLWSAPILRLMLLGWVKSLRYFESKNSPPGTHMNLESKRIAMSAGCSGPSMLLK